MYSDVPTLTTTEPIRVLLIEDNPSDARLTRELLADARGSTFEVEHADRLAKGLERLSRGGVDVVLLDLALPDSQGLQTLARTAAQPHKAPIIVLTGREDDALAVEATRQGAEDYLVKGEADGGMLARLIRVAIERHRRRAAAAEAAAKLRPGRVLGFVGSKGGVGTTTVALNVAACLAALKHDVIAAEITSSFGSFSLQFRQAPVETLQSLLQLEPERINEAALAARLFQSSFGPRVLFGPQSVDEFQDIDPAHAEAVVRAAAAGADYTLLDLPPQVSTATQAAIRRANYIALVVERDPLSVRAGRAVRSLLRSWGVSNTAVGAVVVNRNALAESMDLAEIRTQLHCGVIGVVPPAPDICQAAQRVGAPIVVSHPDSLPAAAFSEITARLVAEQYLIEA